jgi:transposase-like protein
MSKKAEKRRKNRRHAVSFKAAAVERMKLGCNVSELARELKVSRTLLYMWFLAAMGGEVKDVDPQQRKIRELELKVAALEGAIGRQKVEADFLAAALRRIEGEPQRNTAIGETKSTPKSQAGQRRKAN